MIVFELVRLWERAKTKTLFHTKEMLISWFKVDIGTKNDMGGEFKVNIVTKKTILKTPWDPPLDPPPFRLPRVFTDPTGVPPGCHRGATGVSPGCSGEIWDPYREGLGEG